MELLVNIDVPELEPAIAFYRDALGLTLARRLLGGSVVEMTGVSSKVYLLAKPDGSPATGIARDAVRRDYQRHWTPVHVEFVVDDVEEASRRAQAAGARREGEIQTFVWGRLAVFADPFGHGFCLIEFHGRGYGEVEEGTT